MLRLYNSVESPEVCHRIDTPQGVAHPLRTLCNIRWRKITAAVAVAPKHTGDININITSAKIAQRIRITD